MAQDVYTDCVNGELRRGDLVISTPGGDYGCLIGTVFAIDKLGTPEHETDNDTDDVHVDFFDMDYSDSRIAEIEAKMSDLFYREMEFGACPLDDVIMAPNCLIRINNIVYEKLREIADSYDNAVDFCNDTFRECKLTKRLNQNLTDYHDSLMALDKNEIIGEAGMIAAMSDAHYYLTANHVFSNAEVEYLLLFQNPLEVVADKWYERLSQLDDFTFVLDDVFDKKDAIEGGYQLYVDPDLAELRRESPIDKNILQAARHEAERLLYELKKLKNPNHPGGIHYSARISPDFIKLAGTEYDRLLFESFQPAMPMLIGKVGQRDGEYLSMSDGVRARVKILKAPIKEQLREAAQKAGEQNPREGAKEHKKWDGDVL